MLKSYLSDRNISIYRLSKESHVPYSTLNDLVNRKLPVERLRSGQLRGLAAALDLTMDTLYDLCTFSPIVRSEQYDVEAVITVEHKTYCLHFERYGRQYKGEILPVRREATAYLDTLALWKLEEMLQQLELESAYDNLCS